MKGVEEPFQRGRWSPAVKHPRKWHQQSRNHRRWAGGEGARLMCRREEGEEGTPQPSTKRGEDPQVSPGPIRLGWVGTRPGLEMCGCGVGSPKKPHVVP